MENENPVSDQEDPWARMPDETDQEYERRLQRRRRSREKRELADTLKALTEKSRDVAMREDHGEHSEEEEVAEGRAEPPDPVAAERRSVRSAGRKRRKRKRRRTT
jgi:hypothetical protein